MRISVTVAALLLAAWPALSWDAAGHRIIAMIAYDNLTPAARARADALIRLHPDYQSMFLKGAPADPGQRARFAFASASVWPDEIRSDRRFHDEGKTPTPLLAGFPDMGRHTNWHYTNLPLSQDGTKGPPPPTPNAVTELDRLIGILGKPAADRSNPAYALPWFLHIAGDLHNPLHAVARFSRSLPEGDRGGNLAYVENGRPLHAFWDELLRPGAGSDSESAVRRLTGEYGAKGSLVPVNHSPPAWAEESYKLAAAEVYTFGPDSGSREKSIVLSGRYKENARRVAERRAVEAGLRIASILNRDLR